MEVTTCLTTLVIFVLLHRACSDRYVSVEVLSSRDRLMVTVQAKKVLDVNAHSADTEGKIALGLHLLVLNQHSGDVILRRAFNSTEYAEGLALYPVLTAIADGRIVVFGILTEASLNLASVTRRLLLRAGVHSAALVNYRGHLACVLTVAGHTHADAVVLDDHTTELGTHASPVFMHAYVPVADPGTCVWMYGDRARRSFCSRYAGYGDLCDCVKPLPLEFPPIELVASAIKTIPTLIVAGNRPTELYRSVRSLLEQPGGAREKILVTVDGDHPEVFQLLNLLRMQYRRHTPVLDDSEITKFNDTRKFYAQRISSHYRLSLMDVFTLHPSAPAVIILEEDLIAAPDFYSYFNQTAFLLREDPSLYCISAWNDHGALHTSRDVGLLLRVETLVGNGWMLSREIYEEIAEKWTDSVTRGDWDLWLRTDSNAAQRECIVPAVSRVFHYGLTGAHVKGLMTQVHFAGHLVTAEPHIKLRSVRKMKQLEYEEQIYTLLHGEEIVFLNSTLSPCNPNFLPQNLTMTVVVFFSMSQRLDFSSWALLAACLGVWHLDTRGHHRGLIRLGFHNTTLLAIGYPFSDYSYLKPPGIQPLEYPPSDEALLQLGKVAMENRRRHRVLDLEKYMPNLMLDAKVNTVFG